MSDVHCKRCGESIKLKHLVRARESKHRPPDLCYSCLCAEKNKRSPSERKIELAKRRAREREMAKEGTADG